MGVAEPIPYRNERMAKTYGIDEAKRFVTWEHVFEKPKFADVCISKSCHDLDILRWIIDKPCRKVTSFGSLRLFRKEMAPEGSTPRCTDGCAVEAACPFSALKIYLVSVKKSARAL